MKTSFPDELRTILKSLGVTEFEKVVANTRIIKGVTDLDRSDILEKLKNELVKRKIKIEYKKSSLTIRNTLLKSSEGLLKIFLDANEYAVFLKPKTLPKFQFQPQHLGIAVNKEYEIDDYVKTLIKGIQSNNDVNTDRYTLILLKLVDYASKQQININQTGIGNITSSVQHNIGEKSTDRLFNRKINTDFSESIGPIIVQRYFKNISNKEYLIKIPFLSEGGYDFSLVHDNTEFKFSVKTSAAIKTNTIKPNFLVEAINNSKLSNSELKVVKIEKEVLEALSKLTAKEGKEWLYKHNIADNKLKSLVTNNIHLRQIKPAGEKFDILQATKNLENQTKKMNFTQLVEKTLANKLSFFKFETNFSGNNIAIKYQILHEQILKDVLQKRIGTSDALYLRDKGGPRPGKKSEEKIGLTPP